MAYLPIVTVFKDGGYYSPERNENAPIRIYADRWIEDDIAAKHTGSRRRKRLSRREFREVRTYAKECRKRGLV